ncbi:MAG: hypothetical protein ACYCQJ_07785 [Nitrososphaerales archaeon]
MIAQSALHSIQLAASTELGPFTALFLALGFAGCALIIVAIKR